MALNKKRFRNFSFKFVMLKTLYTPKNRMFKMSQQISTLTHCSISWLHSSLRKLRAKRNYHVTNEVKLCQLVELKYYYSWRPLVPKWRTIYPYMYILFEMCQQGLLPFFKQIFLDSSRTNSWSSKTHTTYKFTVGQVFLFITALKPKSHKKEASNIK